MYPFPSCLKESFSIISRARAVSLRQPTSQTCHKNGKAVNGNRIINMLHIGSNNICTKLFFSYFYCFFSPLFCLLFFFSAHVSKKLETKYSWKVQCGHAHVQLFFPTEMERTFGNFHKNRSVKTNQM